MTVTATIVVAGGTGSATWRAASAVRSSPQFASSVDLVEVYVSVTDGSGASVRDLTRDDFEVRDNGDLQGVTAFAAGEFPLAVALAVDRSVSMAGKRLDLARRAGQTFLRALRPADEALIIGFGSEVEAMTPLSTNRAEQVAAVARLDAFGITRLNDALVEALKLVQPARGRRALVALSDGDDKGSSVRAEAVVERARETGVLVYPIAVGRTRPPLFAQLAVVSGGRSFHLRDPRQLEATLRTIADELRHQYLLGYAPPDAGERRTREWRTISVTVKRPGVRVRARQGYFAK